MRTFNRVLSALLALALLVGGILVAIEIIVRFFGLSDESWVLPHDEWYRNGRRDPWSDPGWRTLAAVVFAAGVLLLVLQLWRRRPTALPLREGNAPVEADVLRRSLERSLAREVATLDGISTADVRCSTRRVRIVATSTQRNAEGLDRRVGKAVEDRLARLGLREQLEVEAHVRPRGER